MNALKQNLQSFKVSSRAANETLVAERPTHYQIIERSGTTSLLANRLSSD
jgi:hypothetical protein